MQWIFLWEELVEYLQTTMQWHSESNYVTCVQKTQYDSEIVDVSLVFCAKYILHFFGHQIFYWLVVGGRFVGWSMFSAKPKVKIYSDAATNDIID